MWNLSVQLLSGLEFQLEGDHWSFKKKKIFDRISLSHFPNKKLKLVMRSQLHFLVAGAASVTAYWPLLCSRGLSRRASWGCLLQPSRLSLEASRLCLLIYRVLHLHSALKASPRRKGRATGWRSRRFYNEILQNFGNDKFTGCCIYIPRTVLWGLNKA